MQSKLWFAVGILICAVCCEAASATSDEGTIIDWGDKPTVGTVMKTGSKIEYQLVMKFGLEGYVLGGESKGASPEHSVFWLNCSSSGSDGKPWCVLKWISVDCVIDAASPLDCAEENSTFEENLDLGRTRWETGELDLELLEPDKSKTHVYIQLKYENSLILLESFRAYSDPRHILKETFPPIEYRIPSYTYTLNTPVKLRGMRSESQKQWNDLIKGLSAQDQSTWERVKRDPKRRPSSESSTKGLEELIKKKIPDIEAISKGQRQPTDAENKLLDRAVAEEVVRHLSAWFAQQGFSSEGQKKIMDFLSRNILAQPQR